MGGVCTKPPAGPPPPPKSTPSWEEWDEEAETSKQEAREAIKKKLREDNEALEKAISDLRRDIQEKRDRGFVRHKTVTGEPSSHFDEKPPTPQVSNKEAQAPAESIGKPRSMEGNTDSQVDATAQVPQPQAGDPAPTMELATSTEPQATEVQQTEGVEKGSQEPPSVVPTAQTEKSQEDDKAKQDTTSAVEIQPEPPIVSEAAV